RLAHRLGAGRRALLRRLHGGVEAEIAGLAHDRARRLHEHLAPLRAGVERPVGVADDDRADVARALGIAVAEAAADARLGGYAETDGADGAVVARLIGIARHDLGLLAEPRLAEGRVDGHVMIERATHSGHAVLRHRIAGARRGSIDGLAVGPSVVAGIAVA